MLVAFLLIAGACAVDGTGLWTIERVLRIGVPDGENYALTHVGDLAVGPDNMLFVSQPVERHIKVFDREGRFVRRIGRDGSGPGEFRSIGAMSFVRGRLQVEDRPAGRFTDFAPDGSVLATRRPPAIPVPSPFLIVTPSSIGADGTQYVIPASPSSSPVDSIPFLVARSDGVVRTVAHLRGANVGTRVRLGPAVTTVRAAVDGQTLHAIDHRTGDILLVDRPLPAGRGTHQWRLVRMSVTGDTLLDRAYPYEAVPISPHAAADGQRREADSLERFLARSSLPLSLTRREVEAAIAEGYRIPSFQAPVDRFVLGSTGEAWVRRGAFGEAVAEWLILDARGNCLGRLRLPESTRIGFATAQHVGLIEVDDLEVNYVAVYRVVRR